MTYKGTLLIVDDILSHPLIAAGWTDTHKPTDHGTGRSFSFGVLAPGIIAAALGLLALLAWGEYPIAPRRRVCKVP